MVTYKQLILIVIWWGVQHFFVFFCQGTNSFLKKNTTKKYKQIQKNTKTKYKKKIQKKNTKRYKNNNMKIITETSKKTKIGW